MKAQQVYTVNIPHGGERNWDTLGYVEFLCLDGVYRVFKNGDGKVHTVFTTKAVNGKGRSLRGDARRKAHDAVLKLIESGERSISFTA